MKRSTLKEMKPSQVLMAYSELISSELIDLGFEFKKSEMSTVKVSSQNDFVYEIIYGTSRNNQTGKIVNMTPYVKVSSQTILEFRKELYDRNRDRDLGEPFNLVLNKAIGYLTKRNSYLEGKWNLITTEPKTIIKQIKEYALPVFDLFEELEANVHHLSESNSLRYFAFEYQALDFFMCFADKDVAQKALSTMIAERNWSDEVSSFYSMFERGAIDIPNKNLITLLAERAFLYGLKIDN